MQTCSLWKTSVSAVISASTDDWCSRRNESTSWRNCVAWRCSDSTVADIDLLTADGGPVIVDADTSDMPKFSQGKICKLRLYIFAYNDFLHLPLLPESTSPGPLVQASIGITDEAGYGTISSARIQRNASTSLARKTTGTSPSISPSSPLHTLHTCTASKKVAAAAYHVKTWIHSLSFLPSHSSRVCASGHLNWPQRCPWQIYTMAPRWYGMVWPRST